MLVSDHLNLQGTSPLVGPNDDTLGPRFPDMSAAYDPDLRAIAHAAPRRLGQSLSEGVYAAWLGPAFETPAEIRMIRALGGDLVGMSTVPEVLAARHMGLRCLAISCVTNMAAGILPEPIDAEHVLAVGAQAQDRLTALLAEILPACSRERPVPYTSPVAPSLRTLPSVDRVLADPRLADAAAAARARRRPGRRSITRATRSGQAATRAISSRRRSPSSPRRGRPSLAARAQRHRRPDPHQPRPRAARAAALDRVVEVGGGYSNLEYDLDAGARGSRQDHLAGAARAGSPAPRRRSSSTTTRRPCCSRSPPSPRAARCSSRAAS